MVMVEVAVVAVVMVVVAVVVVVVVVVDIVAVINWGHKMSKPSNWLFFTVHNTKMKMFSGQINS